MGNGAGLINGVSRAEHVVLIAHPYFNLALQDAAGIEEITCRGAMQGAPFDPGSSGNLVVAVRKKQAGARRDPKRVQTSRLPNSLRVFQNSGTQPL